MGHIALEKKLTAEKFVLLNTIIRRHRFVGIDAIRAELAEAQIEFPRSSLYRYVRRLQLGDGQYLGIANETIVIVLKRSTGLIINLSTTASMDEVVSVIKGLTPEI